MRQVFHLILALLVVVTSQGFAVARGAAAVPVGQMVICQGHVAVTVYVDAQGQPIERAHLCPDTPAVLGVALALVLEPHAGVVAGFVPPVTAVQQRAALARLVYFGRGPPQG